MIQSVATLNWADVFLGSDGRALSPSRPRARPHAGLGIGWSPRVPSRRQAGGTSLSLMIPPLQYVKKLDTLDRCGNNRKMSALAMEKIAWASGGIAVVLGAFGAHGLKQRGVGSATMEIWNTAVQYHFYHSLAMLLALKGERGCGVLAAKLFAGGVVIFSGSLYALVLTNERRLGMFTPVGGLGLIAGWVTMCIAS